MKKIIALIALLGTIWAARSTSRVIKYGDRKCTCPRCGCKFRYSQRDVEVDFMDLSDRWVTCPTCGRLIEAW